ncbi:tapasin-like isoform X2 [Conger conger]|uniref:tapasin-like isoform X2 n=1 Tax=Conger conger TaxID=82655 RepID=UPI002A5A34B6|nr:tapasin-like isoform X2 [Conger conger]XP_061112315.1 tapasin-like isoform X2 [Conger conger]
MTDFATIYKLSIIAFAYAVQVYGATCPVLECWFVQEKSGRGFPAAMSQEKSLLYVGTDPVSTGTRTKNLPADIDAARIYHVTDPGAAFCSSPLCPPEGSVRKPQCEINPFLPHPAVVQWAAPLTESAHSPIYLQADWLSVSAQGLDGQLTLSSVMRAPTNTNKPSVIVSVFSRTASVRARLGAPVVLDCGFWTESSSPLTTGGFSVEWRYQFRGEGRLVLAYDGKNDRLAQTTEEGAQLDIAALHQTGNASLILQEAQVRHSGTYICSVYLPYLLAQVSINLEVEEPPSLSVSPSTPQVLLPGQSLSLQCRASGFTPLPLELRWEFLGADGELRPLVGGRVSGHTQARDGTFTQSSWVEVGQGGVDLGGAGEVVCVGVHAGGTRRARVSLSVIGLRGPTVEDSMAMVAVALGLYGLMRIVSWTLGMTGSADRDSEGKKEK